jgi:DnaA family protein
MRQLPLGVHLRDHARLATFVAAPGSDVAAHVEALASGRARPPVTFVWGPNGAGKTHLLQAACAAADAHGLRAGYAIVDDSPAGPAAIEGWEMLDLVCIDDLQEVARRADWERALFGLYNGLGEHGGTLLVAADRSPGELDVALPDLASRLRAGPVFRMQPLDDAGLIEALRRHADARGLDLPVATARYLLRHTRRDMHTLSATLELLDRASLAAQRRLTIPFVRTLLHAPR